ncbi:serine/threonine-protein kinase [Streptomyces sp. ERV7]|uniref:serine/threonine-protein kinase n=1 Tax=Streptomyces sp. ERV7 TaxID=1322334 RepID=UPI000B25D338
MWDGARPDQAGRLIAGRYRLVEQIGRGGMGTVWRAEDELLGRHVALKKLHLAPHLGDDERATLHERTRREARSAARITHPNVVVVHDVVEDEGLPCIVMEYVPSRTLADVLKKDGPLDPGEAARIGRSMIAALRAAHAAGVLHRDVKPGNVLLGESGRVVLTDFGIAVASGTSTLTRTGELVGSIDYCAPERVKGGDPGPACDLWALGATLYQAVEGRPPFRRATPIETAYAIAVDPLEPTHRGGPLAPLIEELLAKEPEDRPTAEAVESRLREQELAPTAPSATVDPVDSGRRAEQRRGQADRATRRHGAEGRPGGAAEPRDRRSTGATAVLAPEGAGTLPAPRRARRRTAVWVALAAVLAAAALGGTYMALHERGPTGEAAPGVTPSGTPRSAPAVPAGYHLPEGKGFGGPSRSPIRLRPGGGWSRSSPRP